MPLDNNFFTKTNTHFLCDFTLTQMRIGLYEFEQFTGDLILQLIRGFTREITAGGLTEGRPTGTNLKNYYSAIDL